MSTRLARLGLCLFIAFSVCSVLPRIVSAQTPEEKQAFEERERELVRLRKERINSLMDQATTFVKRKEYELAAPLIKEVLELDPTHRKAKKLSREIDEKEVKEVKPPEVSPVETAVERHEALDAAEKQEYQVESQTQAEIDEALDKAGATDVDALVRRHFQKGEEFMKEGKYDRAVREFRAAWQVDPAHELVPKIFERIEAAEKALQESAQAPPGKDEGAPQPPGQEAPLSDTGGPDSARSKPSPDASGELTLAGSPRYSQDLDEILKKARRDLDSGNAREALLGYELALTLDPDNSEAQVGLKRAQGQEFEREQEKLEIKKSLHEQEMLLEVDEKTLLPEDEDLPGPSSKALRKRPAPLIGARFRDRLKTPVSLEVNNVALESVLDFLSEASQVNVVADQDVQEGGYRITTYMKDLPLEDALKYLLKGHALTYRIEDEAVWVTTQAGLEGEKMETRVYRFNSGAALFERLEGSVGGQIGRAGGPGGLGGAPQVAEVVTLKEIIEQSVAFPQGANLVYDERTGSIIVTNTPNNHRVIEQLMQELDLPPSQVLIEARFIEVDVTDLDEFVGDLNLSSALKLGDKDNYPSRGVVEVESGSGFNVNTSSILAGKGASGTSTSLASASQGMNLSISGVLSRPQFSQTLNALKEMDRTKTLSAPRVTTLNHQTATIEVTDEFIYPTRFEVQLIQFDINGDGDFEDAEETQFANVPQEFATRDVGVILRVTPDVGADQDTVNLAIIPEVTTASDPGSSSGGFSFSGSVTLPKFTTSNVSTSVSMKSGETVVLGGLIQETHEVTETKVPLVGDIPFVGKLFRKERESLRRRNLIIFVTATILEPPGKQYEVASTGGQGPSS
ncbi:MAG: hypothetical protein HYY14_04970 [Candidatus Omnitrophica bacterium]|nr:hypothetical protein [Candidatus Omnitrophota bacterium]